MSLHTSELALIEKLQAAMRSPVVDQIMLFLNNFDSTTFYFLALALFWAAYNQTLGRRLLYLLVINVFIIQDLKELLEQPRPCQLQPTLAILASDTYGFPSGAAQVWLSSYLLLATMLKRSWFWLVGALMVFLVSLSRVYLGLHFPTDILGGWGLGIIVFALYITALSVVEPFFSNQSKVTNSIIALLSFTLLWYFSLTLTASNIMIFGLGASLGLIWTRPLGEPTLPIQRIIRPAVVLIGFFLIQTFIAPPVSPFLIGLWLSCSLPLIPFKTK